MKQTEVEVELRGPPVAKAFDQDGNPTKVGYIPVVILVFLGLFCISMYKRLCFVPILIRGVFS
jgi:hypothetical protein